KGVNLPEPKKKEIAVTIAKSSSGPLPPPEILSEYEEVCPGTALKIVTAFVNQSVHRIDMESKVVTSQLRQSGRGQIYGFIIAVLFLLVSGSLIYTVNTRPSGVIKFFEVTSLVSRSHVS